MRTEIFKVIRLLTMLAAIWTFGWFVWPTPYEYLLPGKEVPVIMRIERYSGRASVLIEGEWKEVSEGAN